MPTIKGVNTLTQEGKDKLFFECFPQPAAKHEDAHKEAPALEGKASHSPAAPKNTKGHK
jgi:hypothetical protein